MVLKEYPINCGYCYPCLIRKSSLLDIDEMKKYSYQGENYDFLMAYEESEKSADLRAVLEVFIVVNTLRMKN